MKRLLVFAILAAMALGASFASAADLKVSGELKSDAQWTDNRDAQAGNHDKLNEDDFDIRTRARIIFRFEANDNLAAVIRLQYGGQTQGTAGSATSSIWGNPTTGGLVDTDGYDQITLKRMYLEFKWPDTKMLFQVGKLGLALPNNFGSAILGADSPAFVVTAPITDMVSVLAGFSRAVDLAGRNNGTLTERADDEWDHIFLAVPFNFDGLRLTPFANFSILGNDVFNKANLPQLKKNIVGLGPDSLGFTKFDRAHVYPWWVGVSFDVSLFDPITFKGDFNYGRVNDKGEINDRKGWLADAEVSFTALQWFVPKLFGLYATGEDKNVSNGSERMPVVADDFAWGTFFYGGSDLLSGDRDTPNVVGTWAVGAALTKISFIDKLSHDLYVLYINGTNAKEVAKYLSYSNDLTTKDHLWEIDFNHKYMIYDQLAAIVELSYLKYDLSKDVWGKNADDAWKIGVGLQYKF